MNPLPLLALAAILAPSPAPAAPTATAANPIYDFGTVVQGGTVEHVFTLHNAGDDTLEIRKVSPACGCTAATASSRAVPPRGRADIRVAFDSSDFGGNVSKSISVETNDPRRPVLKLVMKGTVTRAITVEPSRLSLGNLNARARSEAAVTITNSGNRPLNILEVASSLKGVVVGMDRRRLEPGQKGEVKVTVQPQEPGKIISGYLHIRTDGPKKNILVPVFGTVR